MEKSLLIQFLGENPIFKIKKTLAVKFFGCSKCSVKKHFDIIDFLIENKGTEVTKKEIIEGTGIARATLFKVWPQIELQEIAVVTRKFGKTKLYEINAKNPIVKKILELEVVLIEKAFDKRREIEL
ncbi:MAG: hypothetical protein AABX95_00865 [Nanoarchaeota archaeon]